MPDTKLGHLISAELLKSLKNVYPLRAPRLSQSEKEVWFEAGQQQVIEFLESQYDEVAMRPLLAE